MASAIPTNTVKDEAGTFIPASQRPDGTWRKPRRVKEGYVPQEEVPLYESKGKQWAKGKPTHVVGMAPTTASSRQPIHLNPTANAAPPPRTTIPGLTISPEEQAAKAKKKKKKKAAADAAVSEVTKALQGTQLQWPGSTEKQSKEPPTATEPAKRLKNLKKRLREVELLEQKMKSGELKNPDKDQLQKVKRKEDLKEQIAELEEELEG